MLLVKKNRVKKIRAESGPEILRSCRTQIEELLFYPVENGRTDEITVTIRFELDRDSMIGGELVSMDQQHVVRVTAPALRSRVRQTADEAVTATNAGELLVFPQLPRSARIQGNAVFTVLVENGRVDQILKSDGHKLLKVDQAVRLLEFTPSKSDPVEALIEIKFELDTTDLVAGYAVFQEAPNIFRVLAPSMPIQFSQASDG